MPKRVNPDPGIYKYKTEAGLRWGAVVYGGVDPDTGRRQQFRKQGFTTKDAAFTWRIGHLSKRGKGSHDLAPSRQRLDAYLTAWVDSLVDLTPNTRINCRNALKPARDSLGAIPLNKLTPAAVEAFNIERAREGHKPTAIYNTYRILKRALRKAHLQGLIPENPCDRIKTPRAPRHELTTWTREHMQTFLTAHRADDLWGDLWCFMCETWVRAGEVAALRWDDIDLVAGTVSINRSVTRTDELKWIESTPKTESSRRTIAMSPQLVAILTTRNARRDDDSNALVFPNTSGGYLKSQTISKVLKRACVSCDVPVLHPHELRHNGGSIAYMDGIDIKAISERMGHANISITLEIYTHLDSGHHKAVAERIGTLIWDGI